MSEKSILKEPIPEVFATLEEAAAFWDEHDLNDYWDETREVELSVQAPRREND